MRFRKKFGALGYAWAGSACLFAALWLSPNRKPELVPFVIYFGLMALVQIVSYFFIYWEIESDHLRERRLLTTREVSWAELKSVSPWGKSTEYLALDYSRPAPMSDRGSIIANPEDRSAFIDAIRRYAPQASVEV